MTKATPQEIEALADDFQRLRQVPMPECGYTYYLTSEIAQSIEAGLRLAVRASEQGSVATLPWAGIVVEDIDGLCGRTFAKGEAVKVKDRYFEGKSPRLVLEDLHGFRAIVGVPAHKVCEMSPIPTSDGALREALNRVAPAVENLACNQEQCDCDGIVVKVSRQALDEVLNAINEIAISRDPGGEIKSSDGGALSSLPSGESDPVVTQDYPPSEATQIITCEEMDAIELAAIAGKPLTCSELDAVTMVRLRSLVMEESSPNMTPDACERQADRIVAAILSRFDVRRR